MQTRWLGRRADRWPKLSGEDAERTRGHASQIRLHHEQYNGGTPPNVRFRMRARVFGPGWWTALLNRARPVSRDGIARRKEGIAMRSSIAVALAGIIARNDSGSGADCRPGPTGCGPRAVGRHHGDSTTARGKPAEGARRRDRHRAEQRGQLRVTTCNRDLAANQPDDRLWQGIHRQCHERDIERHSLQSSYVDRSYERGRTYGLELGVSF